MTDARAPAPPPDLADQVARALAEDVGSGDLTAALVPAARAGRATVITREAAVLCGRPWVDEVFRQLDTRKEGCKSTTSTFLASIF